jgi:hypothetical protein
MATPGRSYLDLLPHEVVGRAFLVDYRRHSHDAFLLLLNIVASFLRAVGPTGSLHGVVVETQSLVHDEHTRAFGAGWRLEGEEPTQSGRRLTQSSSFELRAEDG